MAQVSKLHVTTFYLVVCEDFFSPFSHGKSKESKPADMNLIIKRLREQNMNINNHAV